MKAKPKTVGQRWRRRRALVILALYRVGTSQRFLGDVFDLPASHVSGICRALASEAPPTARGPAAFYDQSFRAWLNRELARRAPLGPRPAVVRICRFREALDALRKS